MKSRPLRTAAVDKPKTLGQRIRFARLSCNLSQDAFAKRISKITEVYVRKGHVSQWETDEIETPSHANLSAIHAVTGFDVNWLATGKGDQRQPFSPKPDAIKSDAIDEGRLALVLAAIYPDRPDITRDARVVALLYQVLTSTPTMAPPVLAQLAQSIR